MVIKSSRTLAFQVIGAAIALNAVAGVVILLGSGNLSQLEERILLTVVTLSVLSVSLLPAAISWQRVRVENRPLLPAISAIALSLTAAFLLAALWLELDDDDNGRIAVSLAIVGLASGHLCLLLLAQGSALRRIASALTILLAGVLLAGAWIEDSTDWRLIGIAAILWFAASLLVPVRQWASGSPEHLASADEHGPVRFCPYCGERVNTAGERIACGSCGATFRVEGLARTDAASSPMVEPGD